MHIEITTTPGDGLGYDRRKQLRLNYDIPHVEEAELVCRPPLVPNDFTQMARYQDAKERQRRLIDVISADIARSLAKAFDQEYTR